MAVQVERVMPPPANGVEMAEAGFYEAAQGRPRESQIGGLLAGPDHHATGLDRESSGPGKLRLLKGSVYGIVIFN